ncbi:MAG TPA: Gfo/Idh/MocA family oxidoreductase [Bacteroidales bacterium]|nr:Gfo/Idh/MocA family oxidoreductase [Bacteroidales bacterium]HPF03439.1 Gfo/Idh/MocA family oxidoreductase [Bacteroidales bacterium]HPJ60101.1 Gfo/Idh/MocA family oxidoreductase [Bacteroidales bacterium]HRW85342.1 Gfo/Idh/MocA family oxidoreductase [Bacteroidales bacterium]
MNKLKTAIIGLGKVSGIHARALATLPESHFTAVCSSRKEKTEAYTSEYGVKGYTDVAEMVEREKIDVAIICTPHPFHREPAVKAMEAGAHVLIEKPLASSLEDCDAILEASERYGRQTGVVSQRRWYRPVQRIRAAIDSGKIGRPVFGTVNILGWRDENYYNSDPWRGTWSGEGGGVLVNQAPHQLDLLQWFLGGIDQLYGIASNLNHPYIEVEDTANAIIRFKSGAIGNIIVSNSQKPGIYGKVHVHGENGASAGVQTDGGAMFIAGMSGILEPPVNDLWTIPGEEALLKEMVREDSEFFLSLKNPMDYFHERQVEDFLRAVIEGRKPLITGSEGRITVEIFTAIYRSTRDNKPVKWPVKPENTDDFDGRLSKHI